MEGIIRKDTTGNGKSQGEFNDNNLGKQNDKQQKKKIWAHPYKARMTKKILNMKLKIKYCRRQLKSRWEQ